MYIETIREAFPDINGGAVDSRRRRWLKSVEKVMVESAKAPGQIEAEAEGSRMERAGKASWVGVQALTPEIYKRRWYRSEYFEEGRDGDASPAPVDDFIDPADGHSLPGARSLRHMLVRKMQVADSDNRPQSRDSLLINKQVVRYSKEEYETVRLMREAMGCGR